MPTFYIYLLIFFKVKGINEAKMRKGTDLYIHAGLLAQWPCGWGHAEEVDLASLA